MPKQPNPLQFLELRRQTWHFVKDIPLPLRGFFRTPDGQQTKRIVRSLGTHDLDEAKRRRAAALADYEAKMAVVRLEHAPAVRLQQSATWHQQMHQRALRHRETISRLVAGDTAGVTVDPAAPVTATTEAERALSVSDWIIDDEAENIQEEHGKAAAEEFLQIVRNPENSEFNRS